MSRHFHAFSSINWLEGARVADMDGLGGGLDPPLREKLRKALRKIDGGLQAATDGRNLICELLEPGDRDKGKKPHIGTDTYYEMAEADNVLKE